MKVNPLRNDYSSILEKAKHIHGDRYFYRPDGEWYVNNKSKWGITCPIHGEFHQSVSKHLSGQGCPKCRICKSTGKPKTKTLDDIRAKLDEGLHIPDQYFNGVRTVLSVVCEKHGNFNIPARKILEGFGCRSCKVDSLKKHSDVYVEDFKKVHGDKYDYTNFVSKGANTKSEVVCRLHGPFKITPSKHKNGQGCPECAKISANFYNSLNISKNYEASLKIPANLYLLKIGTCMYKIGISKNLEDRVKALRRDSGMQVEILKVIRTNLFHAFTLEQEILKNVERGFSSVKFAGWTETFNEDYLPLVESTLRELQSMGTGGTGTTQSGGANSATNTENKAMDMPRNIVMDKYGDGQIAYTDKDTGELIGFGDENDS